MKFNEELEPLGGLALFLCMQAAATPQKDRPQFSTALTVLVVEDEAVIRMSTAVALKDAGFRVLEARDSAEALELLNLYGDIGILVTDVRMPGAMDGLALVARVRRDYPAIRALVVSGNTPAAAAFSAGASAFIGKPYEPMGVVQSVMELISKYRRTPHDA